MKRVKQLLQYLRPHLFLAILGLLFASISIACKMAVPFLTGKAIDSIRAGEKEIAIYIFLILGLVLLGVAFRYLFDFLLSSLGQKIVKSLRDQCYAKLSSSPISYLDKQEGGDLLQRLIGDINTVETGLIAGAGALYEGIVQILITLVLMFYLHWALALLVVILTPLSILTSRFISRSNSRYFKKQSQANGKLSAVSLETITSLEMLQSYGKEEERIQSFSSTNEESRASSFKAMFAASWINPGTRLINNIIYAAVILAGTWMLLKGGEAPLGTAFTVGALSSFLTYSYQYMAPFNEVANVASEVLFALASFDRVQEILQLQKEEETGEKKIEGPISSLKGESLHFGYAENREVLKGFDFNAKKGEKIALVGSTGCGKTTLINLLMRFYDPIEGSIYINEIPNTDLDKASMRQRIGIVLQENYFLHDTIARNIALGKTNASKEEIIAAAKKAHADDFIRKLPQGYDTPISNSSNLSMGEKQLLSVARVMLMEPEIILLDEATSNIDLRTEALLGEAFDEMMKGKTSFVVAHRLSTIKNADKILYMEDGKVAEAGTFQELLKKKGRFYDLYNSQLS